MSAVEPERMIANVAGGGPAGTPGQPIASYVALGDSFTAGTGCECGASWADRIAAGLDGGRGEVAYGNFAAHGATSSDVRGQVGSALQLEPDLATVICGANDLLFGGRLDPPIYSRNLAAVMSGLRRGVPSVRIVTATAPERWDFLPLRPRTLARFQAGVERMNEITRGLARVHGAALLDVARHPGLAQAENFAEDGLHPSPLGHVRAAREMAALIWRRFGVGLDREALR